MARLLPDTWGLYDLFGNLAEWTWDIYHLYGPDNPKYYPDDHPPRVIRGAHILDPASRIRPGWRNAFRADRADLHLMGIRLARNMPPATAR